MLAIATPIALILVGFFLLIWSADLLVDNAAELAARLGISAFLVGIIIVGFGTSAPEMFVSAIAAFDNKGNLALGNALGSNITNIGLVLGFAAFIRGLSVGKTAARRDIPIVLLTGIISIWLVKDGLLSRLDGIVLLLVLVTYLIWSALNSKKEGQLQTDNADKASTEGDSRPTWFYALITLVSIVILMLASRMLVSGAVDIAQMLGVGELIIGLTIVAIGTSLPELAASVAAARKGAHDMIIGNIIGSNIFNTLGVLGITGAIQATDIDTSALWRDFPIMFAFTALMLIFALTGSINRRAGILFVFGYVAYICYLVFATIK